MFPDLWELFGQLLLCSYHQPWIGEEMTMPRNTVSPLLDRRNSSRHIPEQGLDSGEDQFLVSV